VRLKNFSAQTNYAKAFKQMNPKKSFFQIRNGSGLVCALERKTSAVAEENAKSLSRGIDLPSARAEISLTLHESMPKALIERIQLPQSLDISTSGI
jgi:hypothetical protein